MATAGSKLQPTTTPDVGVAIPSLSQSPSAFSSRRSPAVRRMLFVLSDLYGFWIVALLVIAFRFESAGAHGHKQPILPHLWFALLYFTLICLFSNVHGLSQPYQKRSWRQELVALAKSISLATMVIMATIYISGSKEISRLVIGSIGVLSFCTMAGWRKLRRNAISRAVADGFTCQNVLIIGTDSFAETLRDHLTQDRQLGFVVLGLLAAEKDSSTGSPHCIGTLDDLPYLCRTLFVDEIILCAQQRHIVKSVIRRAAEFGVGVRVVPDLYDGMAWGAHFDYLGIFPALAVVQREVRTLERSLKRMLDIALSALALVLFSPLMLLIALIIKLDSKGPVFYTSQRVGKKGRVFSCYKFRTMVTDAEELKAKLQHLNERDGVLFKIRNDPRITRVGRYLRKYSLDELAQFWNVLKGDMSLVGPRPPLASEVKQYELEHYRRLEAAPGITGLWQVKARTSPSFDDYIALDLRYVNNWSFTLDLEILARTVAVVFSGTGS